MAAATAASKETYIGVKLEPRDFHSMHQGLAEATHNDPVDVEGDFCLTQVHVKTEYDNQGDTWKTRIFATAHKRVADTLEDKVVDVDADVFIEAHKKHKSEIALAQHLSRIEAGMAAGSRAPTAPENPSFPGLDDEDDFFSASRGDEDDW